MKLMHGPHGHDHGPAETLTGDRFKKADRVNKISLLVNIVLSIFKILAGVIGHSAAMISDGIHSGSDVLSTIVVMIGMFFSSKPDDKSHPYGHERIESAVAKILANMLGFTAVMLGVDAVEKIMSGDYATPTALALSAAVLSIVVKEWMYHFTLHTAKEIDSAAMKADAWHHRSDALSSVGTFIGIGGAMIGFPILDPIACLIVAILVLKVAIDIYITSFKQLVDSSADQQTEDEIMHVIHETPGVVRIDSLKTRLHGPRVYADVEIAVDATLTVEQGHEIAESVHEEVEEHVTKVKHCMVHVNPAK